MEERQREACPLFLSLIIKKNRFTFYKIMFDMHLYWFLLENT
jgi:hypothetical protein